MKIETHNNTDRSEEFSSIEPLADCANIVIAPEPALPFDLEPSCNDDEYDKPKLTDDERWLLDYYESKISNYRHTFAAAVGALNCIETQQLYREYHKSFYVYCKDRLGLNSNRAYRLLSAAWVVRNLIEIEGKYDIPLPENEYQVRSLGFQDSEIIVEVWMLAARKAGNKRITGTLVRKSLKEVLKTRELDPILRKLEQSSHEITEAVEGFPAENWGTDEKARFSECCEAIMEIGLSANIITAKTTFGRSVVPAESPVMEKQQNERSDWNE